jgi:hypothetical protein
VAVTFGVGRGQRGVGRYSGDLRVQLFGGFLLLLCVRLALSLPWSGPVIVADEIGYLTNARVLGGGLPAAMDGAPFYRGGSSLLVAPLFRLSEDPEVVYRLALVVNAALSASLFPLLYALLTRCFEISSRAAIWPALAAASFPTVTTLASVAMAETVLFPLTVGWLLSFGLLLRVRRKVERLGCAAAVGVTAGALWMVHGRMVVVVLLTVAMLGMLGLRRRLPTAAIAVAAGALLVALLAQRLLNGFLIDRNYGGRHFDEAGERLAGLGDLNGVLSAVRNLVGQSWYVSVASLGVVLLLFATDGGRALRRFTRGNADVQDALLVLMLATAAGLLVVSAVSFTTVTRPDMVIYGRYVEPIVPPLLAVGVARVATARAAPRLGYLLVTLASLTIVVAALRALADVPGRVVRWNIASLPFLTGELGPFTIVGAGIVAMGAVGVVVATSRRWPWATGPVLLLLFLPTTAYERSWMLPGYRAIYPDNWTSPQAAADSAGATVVAYDRSRLNEVGFFVYQWWLPNARFVPFDGRSKAPPARHVLSSADWRHRHPGLPARALWRDPGRDQVLWQLTR